MPVVDGLPASERRRHIPPRDTTTGPPEHPVEHRAVIGPPPTATRGLVGQQRFQTSPFRIGQIVSMQHPPGLPHPALKIRGTRSSPPIGTDSPGRVVTHPALCCGCGAALVEYFPGVLRALAPLYRPLRAGAAGHRPGPLHRLSFCTDCADHRPRSRVPVAATGPPCPTRSRPRCAPSSSRSPPVIAAAYAVYRPLAGRHPYHLTEQINALRGAGRGPFWPAPGR